MRKVILCCSFILCGELASPAHAAVSYQYVVAGSANATTPVSLFTVAPNSDTQVFLFLQETLTGGSTSFVNANGGLFSAGIELQRLAAGNTANATFNIINSTPFYGNTAAPGGGSFATNGFGGSGFYGVDVNTNTPPPAAAPLIDFSESQAAPNVNGPGNPTNTTTGLILLGQIFIHMPLAGGSSTFTIAYQRATEGDPLSGPFGGFTLTDTPTANRFDLDFTSAGNYTGTGANPVFAFTFTTASPVPEPGSLALLGGVFAASFGRWWIRRRNAKEVPAPAV